MDQMGCTIEMILIILYFYTLQYYTLVVLR